MLGEYRRQLLLPASTKPAAQVAHDHYKAEIAELVEVLGNIEREVRLLANTSAGHDFGLSRFCAVIAGRLQAALAKHQPAAQKQEGL